MRSLLSFARQAFSGLRLRLFLLLAVACAPLVALMLHAAWEDRRRAKDAWQAATHNIIQIARKEEKEMVDSTKQLLLAVSEAAGVQSLDANRASGSLMGIHKAYPRYANLGLLTTNGEAVTSAAPVLEPNLASLNFFKRAGRGMFTISGVTVSRNNSPHIYFGYPARNLVGDIVGVVYADLDLNKYCRESEVPRNLPPGTTWTELGSGGKVMAFYGPGTPGAYDKGGISRYPIGRKLTDTYLLTNALSRSSGVLESRDRRGVQTVHAFANFYTRFGSGAMTEGFGILTTPRQSLFAKADQALTRNLTALGLAAALALGLGLLGSHLLILRPVKALVRSSARLTYGDLTVRTGLKHRHDELGQLTLAFDQMAQALEAREREHQRASQKLQVLSHRLVEVQEAERRHIARELHDEIGQSLTAAEMNLQAALRSPPAPSLQKRLQDSIQAVERVLQQVHDLSLNLRPSMLDDLGLEPALRWYTHRQAALTGLAAEFRAEPIEERLDPLIETECFRVAQEALTNVVRHAQARVVKVELRRLNDHIHLTVRDDGIGFDVSSQREQAMRGASLGLLSMEERTSLAGGGLEFTSAPGGGTEVHAWFPVVRKDGQSSSHLNE